MRVSIVRPPVEKSAPGFILRPGLGAHYTICEGGAATFLALDDVQFTFGWIGVAVAGQRSQSRDGHLEFLLRQCAGFRAELGEALAECVSLGLGEAAVEDEQLLETGKVLAVRFGLAMRRREVGIARRGIETPVERGEEGKGGAQRNERD